MCVVWRIPAPKWCRFLETFNRNRVQSGHRRNVTTMDTKIQTSPRIISLIEDAAKQAGNESKLAALIEDTRHHVNAWKQGKRVCPIEAQVLMGAIAGRDAEEVLREAVIEKHEGTPKGEKLLRALGKQVLQAGGAIALASSVPDALAANLPGLLRCIKGENRHG